MVIISDKPISGVFVASAAANQRSALQAVRRLADEARISAYLVGGPVRDFLLGAPVKDLDITVVGDAPALALRLAETLRGRITVHRRFGTATVTTTDLTVDLVTARRESYPTPGALPVVRAGSLADDLARRDFTVNAMAIGITDGTDVVIDPHDGRDDLAAGIIRALHTDSFHDDPTRILRAVRYEQRFGFCMDDATLDGLRSALAAGRIGLLSGDRVRHELDRILQENAPLPVFRRADSLGILSAIHPSLRTDHLAQMAGWLAGPLAWLAALVWSLNAAEGAALSARLDVPSDWARVIDDATNFADRLTVLDRPELAPSGVCAQLDGVSSDVLSAGTALATPVAADRIRRYLAEWWKIAPLLRGSDLLALGVPPGPAVGEALRALRRARLDGEVISRSGEEAMARRWVAESD